MTETEIEAELLEVSTAISAIMAGGQEYTITTASGGGTSRTFKAADIGILQQMRKDLRADLSSINGTSAFRLRAGW